MQCKKCLAYYPNDLDYTHKCDGLMKLLVEFKKKKDADKKQTQHRSISK